MYPAFAAVIKILFFWNYVIPHSTKGSSINDVMCMLLNNFWALPMSPCSSHHQGLCSAVAKSLTLSPYYRDVIYIRPSQTIKFHFRSTDCTDVSVLSSENHHFASIFHRSRKKFGRTRIHPNQNRPAGKNQNLQHQIFRYEPLFLD